MGQTLFKSNEKPPHVVLMGLDGAGKTTLLSRLQWGKKMDTSPTVGFNVGTLELARDIALTVWDVGGQGEMRTNWKYYLDNCKAMVFVVDGGNRSRLGEAQKALKKVLKEESMKKVPLMVLVNKKDVPNSMTIREVSTQLDLPSNKDRDWEIQACSAHTGLGLQQAFLSVAQLIKSQ